MVYHGVDTTRNIIIKLTYQSDYEDENEFVGEGPSKRGLSAVESNQTLNNLDKNKPLRSWWKHFGKEMLSYDVLFDALFLNSRADDRFSLRVPLVAKIDYKGFRAIATAKIEIGVGYDIFPDLGFHNGNYRSSENSILKQELGYVGDVLNLKDNKTKNRQYGSVFENVPVSNYIKVYSY